MDRLGGRLRQREKSAHLQRAGLGAATRQDEVKACKDYGPASARELIPQDVVASRL